MKKEKTGGGRRKNFKKRMNAVLKLKQGWVMKKLEMAERRQSRTPETGGAERKGKK